MSMLWTLHPYQQDAMDKFFQRYEDTGTGALLLAFGTGVGKTATATAIGEKLLERRLARKILLVVPSNLKFQWAKSLAASTDLPTTEISIKRQRITIPDPSACVIVESKGYQKDGVKYPPSAGRARQYEAAKARSVEYVIVSYEDAVTDWKQIKRLGCQFVVLDEASAIKTPGAKRTSAIKRHFKDVPFKLALTATPIENRPEEVFSIMQWVDETVLGNYLYFDKTYIVRDAFGAVLRYKHLDLLHEKLDVAMVRKTREDPDVAPYMPDVDRELWEVELDDDTRLSYEGIMEDLLEVYNGMTVAMGGFNVNAHYGAARTDKRGDKTQLGRLMSVHEVAQLLLNHPALVAESANLYLTTDDRGSKYASQMMLAGIELPETQPKLDYLVWAVTGILADDPEAKVMIFTRYKMMLRIIEAAFARFGYESILYDGDMTPKAKEAAVTRFKTGTTRLFLSSHAGAYGVDVPEAKLLVNYDVARSAGLGTQIDGRHVRASSLFDMVRVVDMVCKGTIEVRKLGQRNFKGAIGDHVIDGRTNEAGELRSEVMSLKSHAKEVLGLDDEVLDRTGLDQLL